MPVERLQKILSSAGIASRRDAEVMIVAGRISVNGEPVRELGSRADPERDDIRVDGKPVALPKKRTTIALNKPVGYVTTMSDERGRPTVLDLLPDSLPRLFPVGRLDLDSEGLLLMTNDGDLAQRLTHPGHGAQREYLVMVEGVPDEAALDRLRYGGVVLNDRRTADAFVRPVDKRQVVREGGGSWLRIGLREGRNRQIRRMCMAIGHPVLRLRRVRIGPVRLGDLPPGEWRPLTPGELRSLSEISIEPEPAPEPRSQPRPRATTGRRT
ncbi:MAG: rRNA pseudouridine synthase [Dehalococcoidia bacterium]|nr:rRNA pseudouridine synthase [Dehalococcoidia bacterium]